MGLFISQINNVNNNKYVQPSFKGVVANPAVNLGAKRLYQVYHEIKNIPHTPCACCGRELILGAEIRKAYEKSARPLSKMIKEGFLDNFQQYPNIWKAIQNLASKNSKFSFDQFMADFDNFVYIKGTIANSFKTPEVVKKIRKDKELAKEVDSQIENTFKDIEAASRTVLRKSSVVMREFSKFKPSMRDNKLEAFEQFEIYAAKYPNLRLSEILAIDEIHDFHIIKDFLQRAETREKFEYHFNNIEKMIKKSCPSVTEDEMYEIKAKVIDRYRHVRDKEARPYYFKRDIRNFLEEHNCLQLEKKINKEIDQLPLSYITKDSFLAFAYNHKFMDSNIMSSFVIPASSSVDHTEAVSKGGIDSLGNYSVMCRDCNNKKGSKEISHFVKIHPEMIKNSKKQMTHISKYILKGPIEDACYYWPIESSIKTAELSEGVINIDITPYCKKALKLAEERIKKYQFDIDVLMDKRKYLLGKIAAQTRKSKYTNKPIPNDIRDSVNSQLDEAAEQIKTLQSKKEFDLNFIEFLKTKIENGGKVSIKES